MIEEHHRAGAVNEVDLRFVLKEPGSLIRMTAMANAPVHPDVPDAGIITFLYHPGRNVGVRENQGGICLPAEVVHMGIADLPVKSPAIRIYGKHRVAGFLEFPVVGIGGFVRAGLTDADHGYGAAGQEPVDSGF